MESLYGRGRQTNAHSYDGLNVLLLQLRARTGFPPISSRASPGIVHRFRSGAFRTRKCLGLSFRRSCLMSVHVWFQTYHISSIEAARGVERALTRALNSKWTTSCWVWATTPQDFFVDLILIDWPAHAQDLQNMCFCQVSWVSDHVYAGRNINSSHFNTVLMLGSFDCTYSLVTSGYQLQ